MADLPAASSAHPHADPPAASAPRLQGPALAPALLHAQTVALVGVSDDPGKTSGRPLHFLRQAGFAGTVYNVNPARAQVQGERAYARLADLPHRPDQVFILTGAEAALASVAECAALGLPLATVLAGGFGEAGPAGVAREARLRSLVDGTGLRLLGPSSIGVVNVHRGLMLTANAAFAEPGLPAGGILCASQSGSLIGALTSRGRARGVGFHSLVSVGGEVDLSVGEVCEATLDDPEVRGYALFLESMRHAAALRRFAEGAAARGKPVVAYKLGRSAIGAELAVSHTGALAGDDDLADAFLHDLGIVRLNTFEGLVEALPLLQRWTRRIARPTAHRAAQAPGQSQPAVGSPTSPPLQAGRRPTVGVVTTTGGGAAMVVDQLGVRGIDVAPPSAATFERLAQAGVDVHPGRVVDLTLAGTRYPIMKATLETMLAAPEFDLVLVAIGSSARAQPQLAVQPVVDVGRGGDVPLACFIVPEAPDALRALAAAEVPGFRTPESCADAIAAVLARVPQVVPRPALPAPPDGAPPRLIDEAEGYALLARAGVPHAPFAVLPAVAADAPAEASPHAPPAGALPLPGPVAVKALHAALAHKTDVGGVVLDVRDAAGLRAAIDRIRQSLATARPDLRLDRVLVQGMRRGLAEVLIGLRRDPQLGPVVVLAAGGVLTEVYRDRSLRLAPVTLDEAHAMVAEVRALQLLRGYRGAPRGDVAALAQAVVAVSRLALLAEPFVAEAEINPLMVMPEGEGVAAVDAVVWLQGRA